ncbi:hypothetical protein JCM19000A_41320 [Silvimonas sp. JCM 19000]
MAQPFPSAPAGATANNAGNVAANKVGGNSNGKGKAGKGGNNAAGNNGNGKEKGGGNNGASAQEAPPPLVTRMADLTPAIKLPPPLPPAANNLDDPQWRFVYDNWANGIRQKARHMGEMLSPRDANDKALYGSVRLRLIFDPFGALLDATVVDGSGDPQFDRAVVNFVKLGSPYGPVPPPLLVKGQVTLIQTFTHVKGGNALELR